MSNPSESRSISEQDQVEAVRQDAEPASDAALIELGKVSETKGGFLGHKPDSGLGIAVY
jgi:hypothetical protein